MSTQVSSYPFVAVQGWLQSTESEAIVSSEAFSASLMRGVLDKAAADSAAKASASQNISFRWRIQLLGSTASGKSSLATALSRQGSKETSFFFLFSFFFWFDVWNMTLSSDIPSLHSDTPGAAVLEACWPIQVVSTKEETKSPSSTSANSPTKSSDAGKNSVIATVNLEICDLGSESRRKFPHIKGTLDDASSGGSASYDLNVLVFSMTDRSSFDHVTDLVCCILERADIPLVFSHLFLFQNSSNLWQKRMLLPLSSAPNTTFSDLIRWPKTIFLSFHRFFLFQFVL